MKTQKQHLLILCLCLFSIGGLAQQEGEEAPDFTLDILGGGSFTLSEQQGKVVMIFVLGYNCTFCISSAPVLQDELVDPYNSNEEYVAIGIDIWNGSEAAVTNFRNNTGMDIPLLLNGSNFGNTYNSVQDRLILIDKTGIVRHRSNQAAGNDVANIKPKIDAALAVVTSIEEKYSANAGFSLYPNPARKSTTLQMHHQSRDNISIEIAGLDGRIVERYTHSPLDIENGRKIIDTSRLPGGMYLVRVETNGQKFVRKLSVE